MQLQKWLVYKTWRQSSNGTAFSLLPHLRKKCWRIGIKKCWITSWTAPLTFLFLTLEQWRFLLQCGLVLDFFTNFLFFPSWYSEHYGVLGPVHFIPDYGVNNTGSQLYHSRDHCSLRAKLLWSHSSIICHLFGPLNVRLLKKRFVNYLVL